MGIIVNEHRPPTKRQLEVFKFIKKYIRVNGYQPTYRDIIEYFGWTSTNAVHDHLRLLHDRKYIELTGKARCIKILR